MAILPPGMSPIPCHACGREVDLTKICCPYCSVNLLVVFCPACNSITPRDSTCCNTCGRTLPEVYRNLTDIETRELFAVELMLHFNATSDHVVADQRENFLRLYGLYKRRLLKEITENEFKQGQVDMAKNMIRARIATERKTGCMSVIATVVIVVLFIWAVMY